MATLMYEEVYPYINSSLKRLVKTPKGYLTNNGLISYLSGIEDLNILKTTGLVGHRFENWVLKELAVWLDRDPRQNKIYFWRTHGGVEVDFVVKKQLDIIPIEISFSQQVERKKVKHLKLFLQEENRAKFGVCIYNGPFLHDADARIYFLPAWAIC